MEAELYDLTDQDVLDARLEALGYAKFSAAFRRTFLPLLKKAAEELPSVLPKSLCDVVSSYLTWTKEEFAFAVFTPRGVEIGKRTIIATQEGVVAGRPFKWIPLKISDLDHPIDIARKIINNDSYKLARKGVEDDINDIIKQRLAEFAKTEQ